jgi:hypothetical protein
MRVVRADALWGIHSRCEDRPDKLAGVSGTLHKSDLADSPEEPHSLVPEPKRTGWNCCAALSSRKSSRCSASGPSTPVLAAAWFQYPVSTPRPARTLFPTNQQAKGSRPALASSNLQGVSIPQVCLGWTLYQCGRGPSQAIAGNSFQSRGPDQSLKRVGGGGLSPSARSHSPNYAADQNCAINATEIRFNRKSLLRRAIKSPATADGNRPSALDPALASTSSERLVSNSNA